MGTSLCCCGLFILDTHYYHLYVFAIAYQHLSVLHVFLYTGVSLCLRLSVSLSLSLSLALSLSVSLGVDVGFTKTHMKTMCALFVHSLLYGI